MNMDRTQQAQQAQPRQGLWAQVRVTGGPPLPLVAGASAALFAGSLIAGRLLADAGFPSPFGATEERLAYFARNAAAVKVSGTLQFASAVPLAIFAASAYARLQRLGVRVGGADFGLVGGILASGSLALSGLLQWALARPETLGERGAVLALQDLVFLTGGPGHVVPLGLLVAGIAVPGLLLRLLPRPLAVAGLAIAAVAELSWVSLVWQEALPLLPLARFPALLWLLRVAFALPTARRRETSAPQPGESARAAGTPAAPSLSLVAAGVIGRQHP